MNYITDGTFWFYIIGIIIAIVVIYCILRTEINKIKKELADFRHTLAEGFRELGSATEADGQARSKELADVYAEFSEIYKVLTNVTERIEKVENKPKRHLPKKRTNPNR